MSAAGQLTVPVPDNGQPHLCSPYKASAGLVLILYLLGTAYSLHYCGQTSSGTGGNVRSRTDMSETRRYFKGSSSLMDPCSKEDLLYE
jgi:hypothetical protein